MLKVSPELNETLGDRNWLAAHRHVLRTLMPEEWTQPTKIDWLALGYSLKLVGLNWRSQADLAEILTVLTRIGIVQLKDGLIRRSPLVVVDN